VNTINTKKGIIHINVDISNVKIEGRTEVNIMNELVQITLTGTRFERFIPQGKCNRNLDEIFADEASFIDSCDNVAFTLKQLKGAGCSGEGSLWRIAWPGPGLHMCYLRTWLVSLMTSGSEGLLDLCSPYIPIF